MGQKGNSAVRMFFLNYEQSQEQKFGIILPFSGFD
jgi:hypothetical protein